MLSSLRARWGALLTRHRLRRAFWLGTPYAATIVGTTADGYFLAIHHSNGTEWIRLGERAGPDDRPDAPMLAAATAAFDARRLALVLPWALDAKGNLKAGVVTTTGRKGRR